MLHILVQMYASSAALKLPIQSTSLSLERWTSPWLCGDDRSLGCYFDVGDALCEGIEQDPPLPLFSGIDNAHRVAITDAASGHSLGTVWYASIVLEWMMGRMRPAVAKQVTRLRRDSFMPLVRRRLSSEAASPEGTRLRDRNSGDIHRGDWLEALAENRAAVWPKAAGRAAGEGPIIGMHVRAGDKCSSGRSIGAALCPLEGGGLERMYWSAARRMRSLYGAKTIVLATDSDSVVRSCRETLGREGFECAALLIDRKAYNRHRGVWIEHRVDMGEMDGSQLVVDALADIDVLGDCDMFIGAFVSYFSRLSYQLILARKGHHVPFVSVVGRFRAVETGRWE
jgi:hypothetical protein